MISRRRFHLGLSTALMSAHLNCWPKAGRAATTDQRLVDEIKRLESESGGRLGVCVLETATGARHVHRGDERFPMCSTFKPLAAAAVLARVDAGKEQLTRRITFDPSAIVVNSPITERRAGGDGMTLAEICDAAITRSDNTAGNLLLASIGGPPGLTAFAQGLGDQVTRLDRDEPSLNQAIPDDPRYDDTECDGLEFRGAYPWDRGAVGCIARATGGMVDCQQDRRDAIARRFSERLACR
jgi:beta-lactamase class A